MRVGVHSEYRKTLHGTLEVVIENVITQRAITMNWTSVSAGCWNLCLYRKPVSEVEDLRTGGKVIGQGIVFGGKISANL